MQNNERNDPATEQIVNLQIEQKLMGELEIDDTEDSPEDEVDDIKYNIHSYPADMTLRLYHDKIKSNQLITPDFQRKYVWDLTRASKLIESFLLGLPVPGVFLYKEKETNRLKIVDGQQRILTFTQFFDGTFRERPFKLKGVSPRWNGKSYEELSLADRYQLDDSVLRSTIIQQVEPNDESSIYYIFARLNTGGLSLNQMELRTSLFMSSLLKGISDLNDHPNWRSILGNKLPDVRMRDRELILRVIALDRKFDQYEKPMKRFLNDCTIDFLKMKPEEREKELSLVIERFSNTTQLILAQLGEKPFHVFKRLNFAACDSVYYAVSRAGEKQLADLKGRYSALLADKEYLETIRYSTSDEKILSKRFALALKYLAR